MFDKSAKSLRDLCLLVSLLIFLAGVVQVFLFAFDLSFKTGLTTKMGFRPHSLAEGAIFFVLASIAFGIIHSSSSKN